MATKTQTKVSEKLKQAAGAAPSEAAAGSNAPATTAKVSPIQTAKEAGGQAVKQFFEMNKAAMAAVLPRHVSPDRMLRIALGALRTTPKLMNAQLDSLMSAIMVCSQLGLEPNTPMGHAYLIPFDKRMKNPETGKWEVARTDVQLIIGYRGMIDLARRSGQIESIQAHAVYENDRWDFAYGLNERLEHVPAQGDRGEIIAFYALAKLKDGGYQFEWMWRDQIDAIRNNSQGYQAAMRYAKKDKNGNIIHAETPWFTHYEEMGRKTAIRRLFKWLPMSVEMATATVIDEAADINRDQNLSSVLEGEIIPGGPLEPLPDDEAIDDDGGDLEGQSDE